MTFKILVTIVSLFLSINSYACVPEYLRLNTVALLAATGIYGSDGLEYSVEDLKTELIDKGQAIHAVADETGINTHQVQYLGSVSDEGGLIQSSFLVLEFATGAEKVAVLKSNYHGGGVFFKGGPVKPGSNHPVGCAYP